MGVTGNEKFVDDYALTRYTKNIKTEIDKYTHGLEIPYRPELCITKDSLVCPYTGRTPIGYDKLEETNCSPDGVIMSDDLNIQKTEHGWWFGRETENVNSEKYSIQGGTTITVSEKDANGFETITLNEASNNNSFPFFFNKTHSDLSTPLSWSAQVELISGFNFLSFSGTGSWTKSILSKGIFRYSENSTNRVNPNAMIAFRASQTNFGTAVFKVKNSMMEKSPFITPYVDKKRNRTTLEYDYYDKNNPINKYDDVLYFEIYKFSESYTNNDYLRIVTATENGSTYASPLYLAGSEPLKFFNLLTLGLNKVLIINNITYINGEKTDVQTLRSSGGYKMNNVSFFDTIIGANNADKFDFQKYIQKLILFNKNLNPGKWTEQYCKEVTTHGFIVPEGKSDKPIYGTLPSSDYLISNYSFFNISSTTEEFKLEGNKLYKVTSAEGIVYTNVTNSSNLVSATNSSAVVITNTAGIGKINGTPAMPCRVEVSNYYL